MQTASRATNVFSDLRGGPGSGAGGSQDLSVEIGQPQSPIVDRLKPGVPKRSRNQGRGHAMRSEVTERFRSGRQSLWAARVRGPRLGAGGSGSGLAGGAGWGWVVNRGG
ncbi:hypothetical protein GCM10027575_16540 [Phytohabitans suffuscus]